MIATTAIRNDLTTGTSVVPEPILSEVRVGTQAGCRCCVSGISAATSSGSSTRSGQAGHEGAVAIHVEFGAAGDHRGDWAVAGCEAARSVLSARTFDGRRLFAVFALEPRPLETQ